eukprot:CAMPEP_0201591786 /NCGR_PEP_ID=MMETSP0190_2-20130828/189859_1 /ASSEMBLY_ACC=CAM_ASM_000263 /TAXON_ID=37353 /ORGANISM="Rosalina sp." /LENGTH=94 /DNA_ID=CAMNT_0048050261 /DNA_START=31 /DNA_END=312 /DNA_ORIENTATION=+
MSTDLIEIDETNELSRLNTINHNGGIGAQSMSSIKHRDESEIWEHDSDFSDDNSSINTGSSSSDDYNYSLEDAISYLGLGKYQWYVMILAGIVW